ncbi:hypothetical protein GXW82_44375, partial [Streptacidiphilus sp. 4-A2]|nr:hypothetical protein [Streptacidiphilus sp. 4-A2]
MAVTKIVSTAQVEYHLTENWAATSTTSATRSSTGSARTRCSGSARACASSAWCPAKRSTRTPRGALMDGCDPVTGERLMDVTLRTAESAKLGATPFVEAVRAAAEAAGCAPLDLFLTPVQRTAWQRLVRQVTRRAPPTGTRHGAPGARRVVLEDVYRADAVASARANRNERVRVDVAGE